MERFDVTRLMDEIKKKKLFLIRKKTRSVIKGRPCTPMHARALIGTNPFLAHFDWVAKKTFQRLRLKAKTLARGETDFEPINRPRLIGRQ